MTKNIPRMNTIPKAIHRESVLEKKLLDLLVSSKLVFLISLIDLADSPYLLVSLSPGRDSQNKLSATDAKNPITKGMSNARCQSSPPTVKRISQNPPTSKISAPNGQKNLEPGRPVSCSRRTPTAVVGKTRASWVNMRIGSGMKSGNHESMMMIDTSQ